MLKILGEHYYLDLDKIEEYISVEPPKESTPESLSDTHISVVRYEMIKTLTETLLTENAEVDETLGMKASEISIPFKIAFNTLINKNFLNKY